MLAFWTGDDGSALVQFDTDPCGRRLVARVSQRLETLLAVAGRPQLQGEVRSVVRMLEEVDGDEAVALRRRLRGRLRLLIEDIWVVVEKVGYNRRLAHIRIYLRGGSSRYLSVRSPPNSIQGDDATTGICLQDVDFRDFVSS